MRVAILDWGIGGMPVALGLQAVSPGTELLYLSDSGFTPYGKLAREPLAERVSWLLRQTDADLGILACNAASSVLSEIQCDYPIVGIIEHGLRMAMESTGGPIGVLAGDRVTEDASYSRPLAAAGRNVLAGNDNGMSAEDQAAIAAALAEDDAPASPEVRRPDATQSPEALVGPPSSVGGLLEGLMNAPGGAAALAEMIAADPSLVELRVCNNGIRDEGGAALATACLAKTHLEHLGMWGNTFGPKACAAIDHLDNGDHDAFVDLDVRTYEVDGKLKASRANK